MSDLITSLYLEEQVDEGRHFLDEVVRAQNRDCRISAALADDTMLRATNRQRVFTSTDGGRKVVRLYQMLSPKQEATLVAHYHMFKLDFKNARDTHPHNYERCTRVLSENLLLHMLHYTGVVPAGFDAEVKDVGSNPIRHLNQKRYALHMCCPVLSFNDAIRKARLRLELSSHPQKFDSLAHRNMYNALVLQHERVICDRKSQDCVVKAPKLMFLHSVYDMSPVDIANSMYAAGAFEAAGCFLFDPIVLHRNEGTLPDSTCRYKKFARGGRMYIRFWFEGDTQHGYEHLYKNYVALLKSFVLRPTYGNTVYLLDLPYRLGCVQYFHIRRCTDNFVPRTNVFRSLTSESDRWIVIYTYKWRTLVSERDISLLNYIKRCVTFFKRHRSKHMQRVRLVVPRTLYERLLTYTLTLPESKFIVQNVLNAAAAYNTREVINGQQVGVPDPIPVEELHTLATAVYMCAFRMNWEEGKVLKNLKTSENSLRDSCGKSVVSKFFRLHNRLPTVNFDEVESKETADLGGFFTRMWSDFAKEKLQAQYEVFIADSFRFIEVEAELEEIIQVNPELPHVDLDFGVPEEPDRTSNIEIVDCNEELVEGTVPGDGDCLLHSLSALGAIPDGPRNVRKVMSDYAVDYLPRDKVAEARVRYNASEGTAMYLTEDDISLLCARYGFRVCLHHGCLNQLYGEYGDVYHVKYVPNHYSPLHPKMKLMEVHDVTALGFGEFEYLQSVAKRDSLYAELDMDRVREVRDRSYELAGVGSCGWVSRSALKLLEIVERFNLMRADQIGNALDLFGAPGGFAQVLLERSSMQVYGVTLVRKGHSPANYDECLLRERFTQIYGAQGDGDLLDSDNLHSIIAALHPVGKFALVTSDPGSEDEFDTTSIVESVRNSFNVALSLLQEGGAFVVRLLDVHHPQICEVLNDYVNHFGRLDIVKPRISKPYNGECYLVAREFGAPACNRVDIEKRLLDVGNLLVRKQCLALESLRSALQGVNYSNSIECARYRAFYARKLITPVSGGGMVFGKPVEPEKPNTPVKRRQPPPRPPPPVFAPVVLPEPESSPQLRKESYNISNATKSLLNTTRNYDRYNHTCREAFLEYQRMLRCNNVTQLNEHKRVYRLSMSRASKVDSHALLKNARGGFKILKPGDSRESYTHFFDGEKFCELGEQQGVLVSDYCQGMVEHFIYEKLKDELYKTVPEEVSVIQAAAGCGKTSYALKNHRVGKDIILTSTRTARADFIKRARISGYAQKRYRTMASYLMHGYEGECDTLWVDEAYMSHPGAIVAVIIQSRCKRAVLLGDELQIPFINRNAEVVNVYYRPTQLFRVSKVLDVSHRVPVDVAARLYQRYEKANKKRGVEGSMYSTNEIRSSCAVKKICGIVDVPPGQDVYLCFTQSEMKTLRHRFGEDKCMTVHMSQGMEWKNVALVRLNDRLAERVFNDDEQVVTAITRHKESLTYYTRVSGDKMYNLISTQPSMKEIESRLRPKDIRGGGDVICVAYALPHEQSSIHSKGSNLKCLDLRLDPKVLVNRCYRSSLTVDLGSLKHVQSQIFDYFNKSGFLYKLPSKKIITTVVEKQPTLRAPYVHDTGAFLEDLQLSLRAALPTHMYNHTQLDGFQVHTSDLDLRLPDMIIGRKAHALHKKFDCLRPVVSTNMPATRDHTWREGLLAFVKRNDNIPELGGLTDCVSISGKMVDNFFDLYVDKDSFQNRCMEGVHFSLEGILEWMENQEPKVLNQIVEGEMYSQWAVNVYEFMIKRVPKPKLDNLSITEYSALQTILYHPKYINAFFCVYFRELKSRILGTLKKNFKVFTDESPEEFAKELGQRSWGVSAVASLELDISKYDKSQDSLALMFECQLMERFGVPQEICNLWFDAHAVTHVRDKNTGMRATVCFQRKSGDASTFIGNTAFLMGVVACVCPDLRFGVFSGDDSVIWGESVVDFTSEKLAYLFNLEVKIISYKNYYFCSKFLIFDDEKVYFVPDPLKLLVKLGRTDIRNMIHLREYHTSFCDHLRSYEDLNCVEKLNSAFIERYDSRACVFPLVNSLLSLKDFSRFCTLYYSLPGDELLEDPQCPRE